MAAGQSTHGRLNDAVRALPPTSASGARIRRATGRDCDQPTPLDSVRRTRALLMLAGWLINIAVVEWVLRRRPSPPRRAAGGRIATNARPRIVPAGGQQAHPRIDSKSAARLG